MGKYVMIPENGGINTTYFIQLLQIYSTVNVTMLYGEMGNYGKCDGRSGEYTLGCCMGYCR